MSARLQDSDKFVLRLPDGLRDAIKKLAKANGRSMNSEIIHCLESALAETVSCRSPSEPPRSAWRPEPVVAFRLGDRVRKRSGANWQGLVVGFYSTTQTPIGYCVESERENGSVQIYPQAALESLGAKP